MWLYTKSSAWFHFKCQTIPLSVDIPFLFSPPNSLISDQLECKQLAESTMPDTLFVICSAFNPVTGGSQFWGIYIYRKGRRGRALENTKRNARLMPLNSFYIFCPGLCSLAWPETQRHADLTGLPPIQSGSPFATSLHPCPDGFPWNSDYRSML